MEQIIEEYGVGIILMMVGSIVIQFLEKLLYMM